MTQTEDDELSSVLPRWLFLRIETGDGLVGWGEQVVEGRARMVRTAIEELLDDYLQDGDLARAEDRSQTTSRGWFYRGGSVLTSAIAGVDHDWHNPVWRHDDASVAEW